MTKMIAAVLLLSLTVSIPCGSASARRAAPPKNQYRWERMSIVRVLPSQVFARLGLTHSTRYGYTRDGYTKKTPDPTFPPGLTDVVPYDATHLLLLRGTTQGLTLFRARVLAAESELISGGARWHVGAQLLPGAGGDPLGSVVTQEATTDLPFTVRVGDAANPHVYRLRLRPGAGAATVVAYQVSLSAPPADGAPGGVLTREIWSPVVTRLLLPDGTVTLIDLAVDRQAARRRLAMPEDSDTQDYQVRLTVEPATPPVAVSPVPVGPVTPAAPGPTPTDPDEENTRPPR